MKIVSMFNDIQTLRFPVRIGNLKFNNPIGMPSGWADSPDKINTTHKLGAGVVVSKTVTAYPRSGNPYPRILMGSNSIINSMGLPNKGVEWWSNKLIQNKANPLIISIKGDSRSEWERLINLLDDKTDILELNISCPNIKDGVLDFKKSKKIVSDISSITRSKIWLKISPEYSPEQNTQFVKSVSSDIDGITAINTRPVKHPRLGNPNKQGGLSGKPIHKLLINQLNELRKVFPNFSDLPIFATGGIMNPNQAWKVFTNYQALPLALTGFLMNGPYFYHNIALFFRSQIISANYKSTTDYLY